MSAGREGMYGINIVALREEVPTRRCRLSSCELAVEVFVSKAIKVAEDLI